MKTPPSKMDDVGFIYWALRESGYDIPPTSSRRGVWDRRCFVDGGMAGESVTLEGVKGPTVKDCAAMNLFGECPFCTPAKDDGLPEWPIGTVLRVWWFWTVRLFASVLPK